MPGLTCGHTVKYNCIIVTCYHSRVTAYHANCGHIVQSNSDWLPFNSDWLLGTTQTGHTHCQYNSDWLPCKLVILKCNSDWMGISIV